MADLKLVPHTKRRRMTKARAARIKLARNGICFICRTQIREGQEWFIEHPDSIAQGGSDDDEDLWPAHTRCKPKKDAQDAASKARRDRIVTAGFKPDNRKSKWASRPLGTGNKQRSATRPIVRKNDTALTQGGHDGE